MNSIPYLLVASLLFFLYLNEQRRVRCFSISQSRRFALLILLVFIGLRGHIYSDFISYYPWYENLPNIFEYSQISFTETYFEPGYVIFSAVIKAFVPNYYGWVFFNTLIDLLVLNYVFKRYTTSRILPYIFFLAFNGLLIEFNLYRNIKAIELFLLSIPYIEQKKPIPYMLFNILGMTFHSSSIIYLPAYFILRASLPNLIKWGGIIFANVVFLAQVHVVGDLINSLGIFQNIQAFDKLTGYTENSTTGYGFSFGYFERTFSMLLFTILYEKLCTQSPSNKIFYNCFWLYYVSFLFFYEVRVFVDRIPTLFVCAYWILYTNVIMLRFRYRQLISTFALVVAILKIYLPNTIPIARYENVLIGVRPYDVQRAVVESYFDK